MLILTHVNRMSTNFYLISVTDTISAAIFRFTGERTIYVDLEDGEELEMLVFGQETEEQALREAHYSLGYGNEDGKEDGKEEPWYKITKIEQIAEFPFPPTETNLF